MTTIQDLLMQAGGNLPQSIYDTQQPTQVLTGGISNNPSGRLGNMLSDFAKGYNDNYNNRWGNTDLPQQKNFITRMGEGLGTVGRFIDSPLGGGLMAGVLNSALGYDNSLREGLTAYVGRKDAQTADRVYRKQLSQMGYTDQDLSNIQGDITPSIYKNLANSYKLRDGRMTYGQLAMFDDDVAEMVRQNPELEDQYMPMTFARDVYKKTRQKAEADINKTNVSIKKTEADTEGTKARTEKTKAETKQVGKPKVTISKKTGGTNSVVRMIHSGGGGAKKGGKSYVKKGGGGARKLVF